MFRALRIAILLLVLATVAQETWLSRSRATSWSDSLRVAIYPINGDGSPVAASYVKSLRPDSFASIERFFDEEARRWGKPMFRPVQIAVAAPIASRPPMPPDSGSAIDNILWSLSMRLWAWRNDTVSGMKPQARLFVLYFDPATHSSLPHSVGIDRGMIGLVNAYATNALAGPNAVIIAHELLHTLGATDKYDLATGLPSFPDGYAEPERQPRHPQPFAEIMGGRIPVSDEAAEIPPSLERTLIGAVTAGEIGWANRP